MLCAIWAISVLTLSRSETWTRSIHLEPYSKTGLFSTQEKTFELEYTMDFSFRVLKKDGKCRARLGVIGTPHGDIETPAFSPVATRASVRALDPKDLKDSLSQVVLGNTYHLYLRPGLSVMEKFGGFAPFMRWDGPTITDSGGYQVSFLWDPLRSRHPQGIDEVVIMKKITDEGVVFVSHIDGSKHFLTAEKSMQIQKILGADIIMAFDQPLGILQSNEQKKEAFERTLAWEERSYIAWQKQEEKRRSGTYQALFGIIQGETDSQLRRRSLKFLLGYDFPGIAIGGQSIGADPTTTGQALDTIQDILPDDKPLHALGLGGGPEGIFEGVGRGVDIFDNTGITRMARSGLLFMYPEDGGKKENKFRTDITRSKYRDDKKPLSKKCRCLLCQSYSRAYIHHLMVSGELLGFRLATIHNVSFINDLMKQIRKSVENGDFSALKNSWLKKVVE